MSEDTFTDPRDGKVYRTTKIGSQVWMAENLNYNAPDSRCYNDSPEYGEKYGRLYDWETAKKAVPQGWHLPTNEEWDQLYRYADGTSGAGSPYESHTAGKRLKAKKGWSKNSNGMGDFDFSALPGGYGDSDGYFYDSGYYGNWWSSNEFDSLYAYYRYMFYSKEHAYWNYDDKYNLFSVRCTQDSPFMPL
jgi:uncharacterized protein (TIGR02145 family)